MRKLLIGILASIVIISLGVVIYNSRQPQKVNSPTNEDIITTITDSFPFFLKDDSPVIEVADMKQVNDIWYIVTIKSINEKTVAVPIKAVLINNSTPDEEVKLGLILGPDTHFTESELLGNNLPDSVILELRKL